MAVRSDRSATARRLAADGAGVHVGDVDVARVEATVTSVRTMRAVAEGCVADVRDGASVSGYALISKLGDGRVDLFFNHAGVEGPLH